MSSFPKRILRFTIDPSLTRNKPKEVREDRKAPTENDGDTREFTRENEGFGNDGIYSPVRLNREIKPDEADVRCEREAPDEAIVGSGSGTYTSTRSCED